MDGSIENYLQQTVIPLRLAAADGAGWPVVLSLWYLYEGGALFCATPRLAKVVDYLRSEPRCGFEVAGDQPPYCGVRGRALATIDEQRGLEILERLLVRYVGDIDNPLARSLLGRSVAEVAIRLEPQGMSTWNFKERMAGAVAGREDKICPES